jgi:hypothetical protein
MMGRLSFLLAFLVLAGSANSENAAPKLAEHPAECRVAENMIEPNFALQQVIRAIAAKHLNILVLGAGSSLLPGANGNKDAYPARMQHALAERLSGVEVKVTTDVKPKRSQALDRGINIARSAGADVVFINPQYSPRTESMIALGTYADDMRWVALQQEVPLFDRFGIMKLWADMGTFDLYSTTKKLDMAEHVHDCIGRLLADLVIAAAKPSEPHAEGGR